MFRNALFVFFMLIFVSTVGASVSEWRVLETDTFNVYFHKDREDQAREYLAQISKYRSNIQAFIQNMPKPIPIILEDMGLQTNGYASPVTNRASLWLQAPLTRTELQTYRNWPRMVSVHEITHLAHLSTCDDPAKLVQTLLGNVYSPNVLSPIWWTEGLAVFMESSSSPYEGRLNDPYYAEVLKTKVQAGVFPDLSETTYPFFTYPYFTGSYAYGSLFVSYLANKYGASKVAPVLTHYGSAIFAPLVGGFFPYLSLDASFKNGFGKPLPQLYEEWKVAAQSAFATANVQEGDWLTHSATTESYKQFLTPYQDQILYVAYQIRRAQPLGATMVSLLKLMNPETQQELVIRSFPSLIMMSPCVVQNEAYVALSQTQSGFFNRSNDGFGQVAAFSRISLKDGSEVRLFEDEAQAFCVLNDRTVIYAKPRKDGFGTEWWKYSEYTGQKTKLGACTYWVGELVRYNEQVYAVAKTASSAWNVYRVQLDTLEFSPLVESNFPKTKLSRSGDQLFFSSHDGTTAAVYSFDLLQKKLLSWPQAKGYPTYPVRVNDALCWVGLTAWGEDIMRVPHAKNKEITALPGGSSEEASEAKITLDSSVVTQNGISQSLKTHLQLPQVRLPVFNEDPLRLFTTFASLTGEGFRAGVTSRWASPTVLGYEYETRKDGSDHWLFANHPFWVSSLEGLSRVDGGFMTNLNDKTIPYVGITARTSDHWGRVQFSNNITLGQTSWDVQHQWILSPVSMVTQIASIYSMKFPLFVETPRYFPENTLRQATTFYHVAYTHNIGSIRKGFWNPNVYFGDVFGSVYADYGSLNGGFSALGAEVGIEGATYFFVPFVPKFGVALYKQNVDVYLSLKVDL